MQYDTRCLKTLIFAFFGNVVLAFWNMCNRFDHFRTKISKKVRYLQNNLHTKFQNDVGDVPKKVKTIFSIWPGMKSQTNDVKNQSSKCNDQKLAQAKLDSAGEKKTQKISRRYISGSSENSFLSFRTKNNKSNRSQNNNFGTTSRLL